MKSFSPAIAVTLALGLSFSATTPFTRAAARSTAATAMPNNIVEPAAVTALTRMSAYLSTLSSFEIKTDTTLDIVTVRGQRVQLGGVAHYKVRRPDGFRIDVDSDFMSRRFYFDGKQFTIVAPRLGYYASAAAPPTIRETLDVVWNKFGIALPLEDLFRWSDPASSRAEKLTSAFAVGPATIDGVATDHYAFREGAHDWEIWIEQGARPIPRKLVIVDQSDPARPAYVARLTWNIKPTLTADDFTFKPGPDSKPIHIATLSK